LSGFIHIFKCSC